MALMTADELRFIYLRHAGGRGDAAAGFAAIEAEARRRMREECALACEQVSRYTNGLAAEKCAAAIRAIP